MSKEEINNLTDSELDHLFKTWMGEDEKEYAMICEAHQFRMLTKPKN